MIRFGWADTQMPSTRSYSFIFRDILRWEPRHHPLNFNHPANAERCEEFPENPGPATCTTPARVHPPSELILVFQAWRFCRRVGREKWPGAQRYRLESIFHKILSATDRTTPSPACGFLQPGFVIGGLSWIARSQSTEARLIASLRLASVSLMMEKIEQKFAYDGKSRRTRGDRGGGGCLSLVTALWWKKAKVSTFWTAVSPMVGWWMWFFAKINFCRKDCDGLRGS